MAASALVHEAKLLFYLADGLVEVPDRLCLRGDCFYEGAQCAVRGLVDWIVRVGDLVRDLGDCLRRLGLVVGVLLAFWLRIRKGLLFVHLVGRHRDEPDDRRVGVSTRLLFPCYVCRYVSH